MKPDKLAIRIEYIDDKKKYYLGAKMSFPGSDKEFNTGDWLKEMPSTEEEFIYRMRLAWKALERSLA